MRHWVWFTYSLNQSNIYIAKWASTLISARKIKDLFSKSSPQVLHRTIDIGGDLIVDLQHFDCDKLKKNYMCKKIVFTIAVNLFCMHIMQTNSYSHSDHKLLTTNFFHMRIMPIDKMIDFVFWIFVISSSRNFWLIQKRIPNNILQRRGK